MSFQSRDVHYFVKAGVSVGVDVRNGEARVALVFSRPQEKNFSRPAARNYLNLRFDADDSTLVSMGLERNVYKFPYSGDMPRRDILIPVCDLIRPELEKRIASRRFAGSVSEMRRLVSEHARDRRAYHQRPDGKLPGVGLDESGMPTPAICPSPM